MPPDKHIKFLLPARILFENGIELYVNAAKLLKQKYPNIEFDILGTLEPKNPSGIPFALIYDWHKSGAISYLGKTDDFAAVVQQYSAVVLPAYYREGIPRLLLEAGALGKPIITADNATCRKTVVDGVSGFLCEPGNLNSLIEKLEQFISLSPEKRKEMGDASRKHIEQNFDKETLVNASLK